MSLFLLLSLKYIINIIISIGFLFNQMIYRTVMMTNHSTNDFFLNIVLSDDILFLVYLPDLYSDLLIFDGASFF